MNENPYAPPETRAEAGGVHPGDKKRMPFWQRHLVIAIVLSPLWYVVGAAITIVTLDNAIEAAGWMIWGLYLAFALAAGAVTGLAALSKRFRK